MNFSDLGKHYKLIMSANARTKALDEAEQRRATANGKGMIAVRVGSKSAGKSLYMSEDQYEAFRKEFA